MNAFKKFNKPDHYTTLYSAKKQWSVSGSNYAEYGIKTLVGISGSGDYIVNDKDIQYQNYRRLVFNSIEHLYYSLYDKSGELKVSGSYDNYIPSSIIPSGSRFTETKITVISLPRNIVGTHIEPRSIEIIPDIIASGSEQNYILDGYVMENEENLFIEDVNNLYGATFPLTDLDYIDNESNYVEETEPTPGQYLDINKPEQYTTLILDDGEGNLYLEGGKSKKYIGQVIYSHGLIIITRDVIAEYYGNYFQAKMTWKSNQPILTHNYLCKVKPSEFNYTLNRSAQSNNNGDLLFNLSGDEFQPYITTIGLYNDANELIAVGKLSQPLPKSADIEMVFQVKVDR